MYNLRAGLKIRLEMKYLFSFILLLALTFPKLSYGHMIGQPPYLKINGAFTEYYPVPTASLPDFYLPQDIAASSYLVNEVIEFELDQAALPIPPEVLARSRFYWEFGDGGKAEGMKVNYSYKKPGTYFSELKVDSGSGFGPPQVLQSTAINILPNKDYKLPKAIIEVNGQQSKDPLLDLIDVNFSEKQNFNAGKSEAGSSKIVEYYWDLGDGNYEQGLDISYRYQENPYTVFPVLRIKTGDGFISDAFVQIKDETTFNSGSTDMGASRNFWVLAGIFGVSITLAAVLTWAIYAFVLKKRVR